MANPFSVNADATIVKARVGIGWETAFVDLQARGRKILVLTPSDFALAVWTTMLYWPESASLKGNWEWVREKLTHVRFPGEEQHDDVTIHLEVNPVVSCHKGGELILEFTLYEFIYALTGRLIDNPILYIRDLDCGIEEGDRGHQGSAFERVWEGVCARRTDVK